MAQYWFKPKRYGYGATPVTWEGWVVTLAAAAAIVGTSFYVRPTGQLGSAFAAILGFDALVVLALLIVSRRKTDGKWRWRWGAE